MLGKSDVQFRTTSNLTHRSARQPSFARLLRPTSAAAWPRLPTRVPFGLGLLVALAFFAVVHADDSTPDQVLKRFGVKRSGSNYMLAAEATVKNKLNEARIVLRRLS